MPTTPAGRPARSGRQPVDWEDGLEPRPRQAPDHCPCEAPHGSTQELVDGYFVELFLVCDGGVKVVLRPRGGDFARMFSSNSASAST